MSDYIVVDEKLIDKLDELKIDNGKCIMLYAKILAMAEQQRIYNSRECLLWKSFESGRSSGQTTFEQSGSSRMYYKI